ITDIGEVGSKDTVEQCAQMIIGEDPLRIDHLWQINYRGYFYPPGREKLHAQGAIDLALWTPRARRSAFPSGSSSAASRASISSATQRASEQGQSQGDRARLRRGGLPRLPHSVADPAFISQEVVKRPPSNAARFAKSSANQPLGRLIITRGST